MTVLYEIKDAVAVITIDRQDVANAVMLLCMEESSWMTGQVFHVDGGASVMDTIFPLEIQGAA